MVVPLVNSKRKRYISLRSRSLMFWTLGHRLGLPSDRLDGLYLCAPYEEPWRWLEGLGRPGTATHG